MWHKIRELINPPVFEDEEKTRVAAMINITEPGVSCILM